MAPSAIETVTVTEAPAVLKLHTTQAATGDYKELLPVAYDQEAEEGKKGFAAAKVSEAGRVAFPGPRLTRRSTPTTCPPGTPSRSTRPSSPSSTTTTARMPTRRTPSCSPRASR